MEGFKTLHNEKCGLWVFIGKYGNVKPTEKGPRHISGNVKRAQGSKQDSKLSDM